MLFAEKNNIGNGRTTDCFWQVFSVKGRRIILPEYGEDRILRVL